MDTYATSENSLWPGRRSICRAIARSAAFLPRSDPADFLNVVCLYAGPTRGVPSRSGWR